MKLTALVAFTALFIVISAIQSPVLFFVGYLWTTVLYPTAFISTFVPLSRIFGVLSLIGYVFIKKGGSGPPPATFFVAIFFALWVTLTTTWAQSQDFAWSNWDWAIESIGIAIAAPLFLRTRRQIEIAFVATLSALSAHVLTAGIKSTLGTGGYDKLGRLMMTNFWLGETSTLSLAAVVSIPMAYYAARHSEIFQEYRGRLLNVLLAIYIFFALMCVVGTSARTGVIALAVMFVFGVTRIWRKLLIIGAAVAIFYGSQWLIPARSLERFGTIATYDQDTSAETRIGVWRWATQYVAAHPWGGGFGVFYTSSFDYTVEDENGATQTIHRVGAAPHSIYFEVLGEQGYLGEIAYLIMIVGGLWGSYRISRSAPDEFLEDWVVQFARVTGLCLLLVAVGGAFIGIAFQPLLYLFLGFYFSIYRLAHPWRAKQFNPAADAQSHFRFPPVKV